MIDSVDLFCLLVKISARLQSADRHQRIVGLIPLLNGKESKVFLVVLLQSGGD